MNVQGSQQIYKGRWYNTNIFSALNGKSFKYYFKTIHTDRYELMRDFDAYDKEHVPMPDDEISGGGRPIPSTPYRESLFSLGQTINFIDNCLQMISANYQ